MDAERLERAARALLVRVDGLCGGKGSAFALPSDALRSERDALRAALAAQPAQADGETDIEWLLRQMETQDLATLRGIAKSFPCERNGCSPDKPAQAGEAVARDAAWIALREFCRMEDIPQDRIEPGYIDRAVAHALRAQRPGGASQAQAGEAVASLVKDADAIRALAGRGA